MESSQLPVPWWPNLAGDGTQGAMRCVMARVMDSRRRGQTLVEYALLIALLSVAVIGALTAFSGGVQSSFADSDSELQKAFHGK